MDTCLEKKKFLEDLRRNFQSTRSGNQKSSIGKTAMHVDDERKQMCKTFSSHSRKYLHHYSTQKKYNLMKDTFESLQQNVYIWKCWGFLFLERTENETLCYIWIKNAMKFCSCGKKLSISPFIHSITQGIQKFNTELKPWFLLGALLPWLSASQKLISQNNCTGIRSARQLSTGLNWESMMEKHSEKLLLYW